VAGQEIRRLRNPSTSLRTRSEGGQEFLACRQAGFPPTPFLFGRPSAKVFQNSASGFSRKRVRISFRVWSLVGHREPKGSFCLSAKPIFSGSNSPAGITDPKSDFSRITNGFVASMQSFLSFSVRFEPTLARISFLVAESPAVK